MREGRAGAALSGLRYLWRKYEELLAEQSQDSL